MASSVNTKIDELLKRGSRAEQLAALCGLCRELLATNATSDADNALAVIDRAVRLDGRSAQAWSLRAEVLGRQNRAGEALGSFDRALAMDPGYVTAVVGKADLLLKLGSTSEAIECYDAAVKATPEVAHIWMNRARALAAGGRAVDAIASVDEALNMSDAPDMWLLRGEIQLKDGQNEEAKQSFERAVGIDAGSKEGWYQLALAAAKAKDNETAKRAAHRFLELAAEGDVRIATLRSLLFQLDRHGGSQVSGVQPRRPQRISSSRMRRVSRAMKAVTVPAAKSKPELESEAKAEPPPDSNRLVADVDSYEGTLADLIAADSLHRAGRHVEALRKVEVLVKTAPNEANAWILRARVMLALGKADVAAKSVEEALALDDGSAAAWKLAARSFAETKKPDRALEAIGRAEKIAPQDAEVHRLRGDWLVAQGRHTEAVYALEKAVHYAPGDAEGWLALGRVLRQLRRAGAAKDALEKARDLAESASNPDLATEARSLLGRLG